MNNLRLLDPIFNRVHWPLKRCNSSLCGTVHGLTEIGPPNSRHYEPIPLSSSVRTVFQMPQQRGSAWLRSLADDLQFYEALWLCRASIVSIIVWQEGVSDGGGGSRPILPLWHLSKIIFLKGSHTVGIFSRPVGILLQEEVLKLTF